MAGVTPADIDVREIYDCYTYTTLITLEDYGFCAKGEGGQLAESGALGARRRAADEHRRRAAVQLLPVGDDAAVRSGHPDARRRAADGRSTSTRSGIVSGNGGVLDFHSTLVLGAQPR